MSAPPVRTTEVGTLTALKRLEFDGIQIIDTAEPDHGIQFAGCGLDWFHPHGDGWCYCLDPGTTPAAMALEVAVRGTDDDLLAHLRMVMDGQSHQAFPWAVHMTSITQRLEFYERHRVLGAQR